MINFNEFYSKNYKGVFSLLRRSTNYDNDILNMIVNDAFIKIFESYSELDNESTSNNNLGGLLFKIAKNKLIDYHRKNSKVNIKSINEKYNNEEENDEFIETIIVDDSYNGNRIMIDLESREILMRNIENIDSKYRVLAQMYFIKEMQYDDIAKSLNKNINTVKTLIRSMKFLLRKNEELIELKN